jgi:sterol 3beta-glucosyltransferase
MRIVILTVGSLGDVRPLLALGLGLKRSGHQVLFATHNNFADLVSKVGLSFAPLPGDPNQIMHEQQNLIARQDHLATARIADMLREEIDALLHISYSACVQFEAEAILYTPLSVAGYHIAEKLGIPCFVVGLAPHSPTHNFPSPSFDRGKNLCPHYNWWSYVIVRQLFWQRLKANVNQWRKERLGLLPLPLRGPYFRQAKEGLPTLYGWSDQVLPRPDEWPQRMHVCGYWFLDLPWHPDPNLIDFLDSGDPPVYFGFGSMPLKAPDEMARLIAKAVQQTGQRAIVFSGWGNLGRECEFPDSIYFLEHPAEHHWLLPRCASAVHHGGAGTSASCLRAGIPSLVIPFLADQPFWGRRLAKLDAGVGIIPPEQVSEKSLTEALERLTKPQFQAGARRIASAISTENGVAKACTVVEHYLSSARCNLR